MEESDLQFSEVKKEGDIESLANFDMQVFIESQDFSWDVENVKKELKTGWKLFSVKFGKETIAALLLKNDKDTLLTKNTPIKMAFQGNGFSHQIKNFYEQEAGRQKLRNVVNYCPVDNFRMIALNESHGYKRTGNCYGPHKNIIEWVKPI